MKDIHLKVNLGVVVAALLVWLIMIIDQIANPYTPLPNGLQHLFDNLTGMMFTILTAFQKETP